MQLFPAIDLRGGKVVRLTQGDYSRMTVYGEDPCAQAREFLAAGAKNLQDVYKRQSALPVRLPRRAQKLPSWKRALPSTAAAASMPC